MPTKSPPDTSVTGNQALFLSKSYMLGEKHGYAAFVPGWEDVTSGEKHWEIAASRLTRAGATRVTASEAIEFLKGSRPTTEAGIAFRLQKGRALLLGLPVPKGEPVEMAAPVRAPARPSDSAPLRAAELELALAQVALAQARLKALRG